MPRWAILRRPGAEYVVAALAKDIIRRYRWSRIGSYLALNRPLMAEAVSKLHISLTPEVAFKHNVRRY